MAEFKINKQLSSEIGAMKTAGNALNDNYSATDAKEVSSLSTAYAFIKEQTQIKNVITLYARLLAKDAKDLDEMVAAVEAADEAAATTYTT